MCLSVIIYVKNPKFIVVYVWKIDDQGATRYYGDITTENLRHRHVTE